MNENTIYLWPDGSWRYSEEYSEFYDAWKGDDYLVVDMPEEFTYDEIDDWCEERARDFHKESLL